jgi:hypothetical protein
MAMQNTLRDAELRWQFSPRRFVNALLLISLLLFLAGLAGQAVRFLTGDGFLWGFTPKFNLDAEMNVPTWFSAALFALCGFLTLQVAAMKAMAGQRRKWRFLAGVFLLCSIDEVAACHEILVVPVRNLLHTHGLLYFAWVVPAILLVGLMTAFLASLFFRLPSPVKWTFLIAALLFFGGNLGLEMVGGAYVELHGPDHFTYALIAHLEEFLELLGQVFFIKGALDLVSLPGMSGRS